MIVSVKDAAKLIGVSVVSFCAVFVCNLFLNYNIDITSIDPLLTNEYQITFYDTLKLMGNVVALISGGCLLITSVVILFFYIKQYINAHSKELGILKALGYSKIKISKGFFVFGLSILIGSASGYLSSFLLMPAFYEVQNEKKLLPQFYASFHPSLLIYLVVLPAVCFSLLSVAFAFIKLKKPVLLLLKNATETKRIKLSTRKQKKEMPFLSDLKKATLKSKKTLVFLMGFSAFCFSSMVQMSFSMKELSSIMMGLMIILIGVILACTTLFMAVSTVISSNKKSIAMMRVEGYSVKDCRKGVLNCYRPVAYIGFAIGTAYQYGLLRISVDIIFKDIENIPQYNFDFKAFIICLIAFVLLYEFVMRYFSGKIRKCSLKEIMESGE